MLDAGSQKQKQAIRRRVLSSFFCGPFSYDHHKALFYMIFFLLSLSTPARPFLQSRFLFFLS